MVDDLKKNSYGVTKIPGPPELTFRDVDQAILQLFERRINMYIEVSDPESGARVNKQVPVIFAGGERFAQVSKLGRYGEVRDRNGKILKPCIAIVRQDIDETISNYKGIATAYPHRKLVHRRISPTGGRKLKTPSAPGAIIGKNTNYVKAPPTEYIIYDRPEYVTVNYTINYWSAFLGQMNEMVTTTLQERDMDSMFYLRLDNGYRLECFLDGTISNQSNLENFLDEERVIRNQFGLRVSFPLRSNRNKTHDVLVRQSPRTFAFAIEEKQPTTRITDENYFQWLKGAGEHINPFQIVDESTLSTEDLNPYRRPRRAVGSALVNPLFSPGRLYDLMVMSQTVVTQREYQFRALGSRTKRERTSIPDNQDVYDRIFNGRYVVGGKAV